MENGENYKKINIPVRENTRNLEILPKCRVNMWNFVAQVVNSLILKIKHSAIMAVKISSQSVGHVNLSQIS